MDKENKKISISAYIEYIDINNENNPIEWMQIKEKKSKSCLLKIPYSPLIKTDKFESIYKQKIFMPGHKLNTIYNSINQLYKNNEIIFSKDFLEIINSYGNKEIKLKINYNSTTNFTINHLYFLYRLVIIGPFNINDNETKVTSSELIIKTNKQEISTNLYRPNFDNDDEGTCYNNNNFDDDDNKENIYPLNIEKK